MLLCTITHSKQCGFEALLNSAKLPACCQIWWICAFQSSFQMAEGCPCLNYCIFSTKLQGDGGLCWDTWVLAANMARMTRALLKKDTDSQGWAEEKGSTSSRDNPPQAHLADLKYPYAGIKKYSEYWKLTIFYSFWKDALGFFCIKKSLESADRSRFKI